MVLLILTYRVGWFSEITPADHCVDINSASAFVDSIYFVCGTVPPV